MSFRSLAILAVAATAVSPTIANAKVKTPTVIVPAASIADPAARVCMPRTTSPAAAKDKSLPDTLCETVEGWATRGVTVRAK